MTSHNETCGNIWLPQEMFVYLGISKLRCRWRYRESATIIINNSAPGKILPNNYTTPHTKIIHTVNIMFTTVHLLLSVLNTTIYISSVCIYAAILLIYPIRVTVHRRVYMRRKGWDTILIPAASFISFVDQTIIELFTILAKQIDFFSGENEGQVTAEVELTSEEQEIELPEWVIEEVTDDKRYFNSNLVEKPYCTWEKK